jgi:hypothetical protein
VLDVTVNSRELVAVAVYRAGRRAVGLDAGYRTEIVACMLRLEKSLRAYREATVSISK